MTQLEQKKLEAIFTTYISGEMVSEEDKALLQQHPEWADRLTAFEQMQQLGMQADAEVQVPDWNRNMPFQQLLAKPSWWQVNGMSAAALCFSVFACVVMLFDLRVDVHDGQLAFSTGKQQQQDWMQSEFQQLAQQNQTEIDQLLVNFEQKQNQNSAKLVTYVLDSSRTERKEEIADFVHLLQEQRNDDMRYLKQEFRDINYNLRLANSREIRAERNFQTTESELTE